jgi:hypothetical protein
VAASFAATAAASFAGPAAVHSASWAALDGGQKEAQAVVKGRGCRTFIGRARRVQDRRREVNVQEPRLSARSERHPARGRRRKLLMPRGEGKDVIVPDNADSERKKKVARWFDSVRRTETIVEQNNVPIVRKIHFTKVLSGRLAQDFGR